MTYTYMTYTYMTYTYMTYAQDQDKHAREVEFVQERLEWEDRLLTRARVELLQAQLAKQVSLCLSPSLAHPSLSQSLSLSRSRSLSLSLSLSRARARALSLSLARARSLSLALSRALFLSLSLPSSISPWPSHLSHARNR